MSKRSEISLGILIRELGISRSKYYSWISRNGQPNRHNGQIPRYFWILPHERKAILNYCRDKLEEGYRRLTYMMLDDDIVAVSPSTTYRVLRTAGWLKSWSEPRTVSAGKGFQQPKGIHHHWHMDISYVNFQGTFLFLITVMDGYSRKILHHELRRSMKQYDVQITLQRAVEKYPDARPVLISDNGKQFLAKEFKEFLRFCGLRHVQTSPHYPQSNGKMERFYGTIKSEAIRRQSYLSIEDARGQIDGYIKYYNEKRLHSSIYYLTPKDVFEGNMEIRLKERQRKLYLAAEKRKINTLNQVRELSIFR
jgi:transposase InsO family protein